MKPLICPQCGGKITDYKPWDNFAVCGYCETKSVIATEKPKPIPEPPPPPVEPVYQPFESSAPQQNIAVIAFGAVLLIFVGIVFIGIIAKNKKSNSDYPPRTSTPYVYKTATPTASVSPTPVNNLNLLDFGGKGTSIGAFQDAGAIAVDGKGRIYVGDNSLRVQQFDDQGNFLKLWQIPSETSYYKRARSIEKIGVDNKDRLYVLIDYGVVLVYENASTEPDKIIHFSPNPIQDFAFRADGGRVFLINGGDSEYFVQVNEAGKTVRRVDNFHTEAADASMSPPQVGLAAIRIAVDGAGNIFSIYALGDLGSYQLSYNEEDFRILRFTPEGKFVDKFVPTMNSVGIAVDNQSRIYISETGNIGIYSKDGKTLGAVPNLTGIDDFALDKQNNVYIVHNDRVIKRAAVPPAPAK